MCMRIGSNSPFQFLLFSALLSCVKYLDFKPGMRLAVFCVLNHVIYDAVLLLMCKKHFNVISCVQVVYIMYQGRESIWQKVFPLFILIKYTKLVK